MQPERLRLALAGLVGAAAVFATAACTTDVAAPVASSTTHAPTERTRPGGPVTVVDLALDELEPGELQPGTPIPNPATPSLPAYPVYPQNPVPLLQIASNADGRRAIRFPDPCDLGPQCQRGILEIDHHPTLDPGVADFEFGVSLRLDAPDIRDGANLIQKGYSTGGASQWKLQVDDREGRPSCVLTGLDGRVQQIRAPVSVADGRWHDVSCSRTDQVLVIDIDGSSTRTSAPNPIQITNTSPVRIGGKHTKVNADPFFGDIARVWYSTTGSR